MLAGLTLLLFIVSTAAIDFEQYLQPTYFIDGAYDDFSKNPSHVCARNCNGTNMICYYKFSVGMADVMGYGCGNCPSVREDCDQPGCFTLDGVKRSFLAVSKMIPGPSIQVCRGDTVVVDVKNALLGKQTTIHWHGISQAETPWMDGAYMISQCPITPGQTFRYRFKANEAGTLYWHDHAGLAKVDGVQGSLIVREALTPYNNMDTYDIDLPSHVVFISDWKHFMADDDFPEQPPQPNQSGVSSFLINGKGVFIAEATGNIDADYQTSTKTPLAIVKVQPGRKYRLRLVGALCFTCGVSFSVSGHRLLLISGDGSPLKPLLVDQVDIYPGERYDVVVEARQPTSTYWIKVQGLSPCTNTYQLALLKYDGSELDLPPPASYSAPSDPIVSNAVGDCSDENQVCIDELQSSIPLPSWAMNNTGNQMNLVQFGFHLYDNHSLFYSNDTFPWFSPTPRFLVRPTINGISFVEPSSPLLTQPEDLPPELFCSDDCRTDPKPDLCQCLDPIELPIGGVLDLVVTDINGALELSHPLHVHGMSFYVLEVGFLEDDYSKSLQTLVDRVNSGQIPVNSPPFKDTVVIKPGGYAVVRLKAENPGVWLVHCHFLYHHVMGMTTYLKVGQQSDVPPPPPRFPTCNNFLPD